jgi:alpha-beta hydrolase superfamily lysophospholipase
MQTSSYPRYAEETLTPDGLPVVVSLYNDDPGMPTVVFLPGTMVYPLFYDPFLGTLAGAGMNVVGVHFTGHGKSPEVKPDFCFDDLVSNALEAIRFSHERYGKPVALLGSSQGSMVAVAAAAGNEKVSNLIIHDLALPQLPETMYLVEMPRWLRPMAPWIPSILKVAAGVFPRWQISLQRYLKPEKLTRSEALAEAFLNDPLCRKSYPLSFIASLFTMDLECALDGRLQLPVLVMTASGDPLFTQTYMDTVFAQIRAPHKEMLTFKCDYHGLFLEGDETIYHAVSGAIKGHFP